MSEPKRYKVDKIGTTEIIDCVSYEDYARLKAECQARQAENSVLAVECDSLKAEVEELKKPAMPLGYNLSQYIRMANSETLEFDNGDIFADMTLPERIKYIVESHASLKADLQMEKENEDRLVREWQKANNEVYGLQTQVAALIDDQTRLKAEVERLTKGHSIDFVRAEMYRHLLDENAKLKEEVMRMRNDAYKEGDILQKCCEHQKNRIERLKAEVENFQEYLKWHADGHKFAAWQIWRAQHSDGGPDKKGGQP